jgi:DNA repair protein RadA/Sms
VKGAVVLIGGDPASANPAAAGAGRLRQQNTLYVSGEESQQIALRAQRLGLTADKVRVFTENRVETIIATAQHEKPAVMVIDSIRDGVYREPAVCSWQRRPGA